MYNSLQMFRSEHFFISSGTNLFISRLRIPLASVPGDEAGKKEADTSAETGKRRAGGGFIFAHEY